MCLLFVSEIEGQGFYKTKTKRIWGSLCCQWINLQQWKNVRSSSRREPELLGCGEGRYNLPKNMCKSHTEESFALLSELDSEIKYKHLGRSYLIFTVILNKEASPRLGMKMTIMSIEQVHNHAVIYPVLNSQTPVGMNLG